jgi:asparagine synthase (glutamine-hydrolysing)
VTGARGGDGGDELFGGYDAYVADQHAHRYVDPLPAALSGQLGHLARLIPVQRNKRGPANQLRRFLEGAALPSQWQHVRWMIFMTDRQRSEIYTPSFYDAVRDHGARLVERMLHVPGPDRLGRQNVCDLSHYLAENILPKIDMMSMAVSLEARVPYLDNDLVDLALRIPADLKIKGGVRKYILKKAFSGRLPASILGRGKEGFSMPMKNWLNNEWNGLMHELLCEQNLASDGLFRSGGVARLMHEHEAGSHNHSHLLWALMVFQLWKYRFLRAN